jgi:hypothetical protein
MITIPESILTRLNLFSKLIEDEFSFLKMHGFTFASVSVGRTDKFLDYYSSVIYLRDGMQIELRYSTEIIAGMNEAFPEVKQKPVRDNLISFNISRDAMFMSVDKFIEIKYPKVSIDGFSIPLNSSNLEGDIRLVIGNYSAFAKTNLLDVVSGKTMYNCYTSQYYENIFEERHYRLTRRSS